MVLCKFFQQGSCRFGSKCVNEHFDVKQIIKADVEAALNGKQWPLSTYGPFKDKPSIPNFIEDQSFEEIRMLCYESKQKNFFEQFHQQFAKEAMDANNKMKALLQMTPDIVNVVIKLYELPSDNSGSGVTAGKSSNNNPFGMTNSSSTNAGSIFAKSTTTNNINSPNNIFGSSNRGFGATNATGNNIFGNTNAQLSGGIFGNSSAFQQQQQPQPSIFGQPATANSIFGGGNTSTQQTPSVFGQQQTQPIAPALGNNVFAATAQQQPQQSSNIFGLFPQQNQQQSQQQSSVFGQPQPQQQNTSIFGQTSQPPQPQQGLFVQAAQTIQQQTQQPQQQGLFAQAVQQIAGQSTVGGQSIFPQVTQQSQSVFGQSIQQQQQQPNPNIFQQNSNAAQQLQQTNPNIFQTNAGQQQPLVQNQQTPTGIFQQAVQQTQYSSGHVSLSLYSRMEDLKPEEVEAFKADSFLPGKIPFNPPPRELIN